MKKSEPTVVSSPKVSPFGEMINELQIRDARLAAETAVMTFLRPPRVLPNAQQRLILDKANISTLQVDDLAIRTYTWSTKADAASVLISHGYGLATASMVHFVQPLLDAGLNVVAWDQAAHGESEGDWGDLEIFKHTICALALQHLPLAAIIGQSVGAATALIGLAENPALECPRLVCLSCPTQMDTPLGTFLKFNGCSLDIIPLMHEVIRERNILVPTYLRDLLPKCKIKSEVLLVQDRNDEVTTLADAERLACLIDDSRIEVTKGLRHFGFLTDKNLVRLATRFIVNGFAKHETKI